jgi:hypothetical protein
LQTADRVARPAGCGDVFVDLNSGRSGRSLEAAEGRLRA